MDAANRLALIRFPGWIFAGIYLMLAAIGCAAFLFVGPGPGPNFPETLLKTVAGG